MSMLSDKQLLDIWNRVGGGDNVLEVLREVSKRSVSYDKSARRDDNKWREAALLAHKVLNHPLNAGRLYARYYRKNVDAALDALGSLLEQKQ